MNNNIKLTLLLLFIALILGFGIAKKYYFAEDRYRFNRQLFGIGKEWVEVAPPKPIKCDLMYQKLVLNILTEYEIESNCLGCPRIKLKDGTLAKIECILVASDNTEYSMRIAGFHLGTSEPIFEELGGEVNTPRKRSYRAVKLRSDSELLCSEVRLECTRPPWFE